MKPIWIRRLPGIDAIEEAIKRSEELGKPVIMNIGGLTGGAGNINTENAPAYMAGVTVLSHVASICARLGTQIVAPVVNETVFPLVTEAIREAYIAEGKAEEFNQERMTQFVATYGGIAPLAERLRPGANIMIGPFWGDAMIHSDMFGRVGAIQVGGTSHVGSLPYFAAACDYCLIGEEIFAIEAYLIETNRARYPILIQDLLKFLSIAIIFLGVVIITLGNDMFINLLKW